MRVQSLKLAAAGAALLAPTTPPAAVAPGPVARSEDAVTTVGPGLVAPGEDAVTTVGPGLVAPGEDAVT
ncbi:glycoside hydrolase family 75 protein, partial [Streptomyces sp. NPDC001450]